jgi:methylmalonyl-CoA mutase
MAIQMIITKELGWAKNENPLQGSYFIEELTDLVEEAVLAEFDRISSRGGVLGAMETHYQRTKIQEESLYYERLKHSGELPIVGVNTFLNANSDNSNAAIGEITRASTEEKREQITNLRNFHKDHEKESKVALAELKLAATQGKNLFESLMKAARVCSLGQMTFALYQVGGEYRRAV